MKLSEAKIGDKVYVYLVDSASSNKFGYLSERPTKLKVKATVIGLTNYLGADYRCIGFDEESGVMPSDCLKISDLYKEEQCSYIADIDTIKKTFAGYCWYFRSKNLDCELISGATCQDATKVPCTNKWCNWKCASTDKQCLWCGSKLN